jgi:hypothetical protein
MAMNEGVYKSRYGQSLNFRQFKAEVKEEVEKEVKEKLKDRLNSMLDESLKTICLATLRGAFLGGSICLAWVAGHRWEVLLDNEKNILLLSSAFIAVIGSFLTIESDDKKKD